MQGEQEVGRPIDQWGGCYNNAEIINKDLKIDNMDNGLRKWV